MKLKNMPMFLVFSGRDRSFLIAESGEKASLTAITAVCGHSSSFFFI